MKTWLVVYGVDECLEYERFADEQEARAFALEVVRDGIKETEVVIIHIGDIFFLNEGEFQLH